MSPLQITLLIALAGFLVAVIGDVPGAPRWLRDEHTIWSGLFAFAGGLIAAMLFTLKGIASALPF